MSFTTRLSALAATLQLSAAPFVASADRPWPPAEGVPMTTWGKELVVDQPAWPEYPRPQLVRERWLNLNGMWDFTVAPLDAPAPTAYGKRIRVPFAPQSVLSQIGAPVDPHSRAWYRRSFSLPGAWSGQRVWLRFGAVDWEAHVWVNGTDLSSHRGGYDGFAFDITDALKPGADQELVVSAWNPIEAGQPRGKQSSKPGGIFYTPTTGIWQTVWLEPLPATHIDGLRIVPDAAHGRLQITVEAAHAGAARVEVKVSAAGTEVARASGRAGAAIDIAIPAPRLWWPESPFLYDLAVTLADDATSVDTVASYAGLRSISVGPDGHGRTSLLLNGAPVFQLGLLDQGFWPDGVYTAPSDAALRSDIEAARALGFNMLRKHVKVEPERWYYWADRLGMLVWQDMPSATEMGFRPRPDYIAGIEANFETELRRMIEGRRDHPSIVAWVPFNEGWGLSVAEKAARGEPDRMDQASRDRQKRMVEAIREEDSTRLIDAESGAGGGPNQGANFWDAGLGDILDFHCYGGHAPRPEEHRASAIGECGWGVGIEASLSRLLKSSQELGESAIVITQLTDVENETNGALRYDRTAKFPLAPVGLKVIAMLHGAGYLDYPGSGAASALPGTPSAAVTTAGSP